MKNTQSKIETNKNWEKIETTYLQKVELLKFLLADAIKEYVKCRKKTENLNPKIFKTKNRRLIMQSKCSECRNKKSRFVKEQEAKRLLSTLGIKTLLSNIPQLNVLFLMHFR